MATLGLLAAGLVAGPATSASAPRVDRTVEAAVLVEMNAARARAGVPKLKVVRSLRAPARAHASYMHTTGELSHSGPGGAAFWKRIVKAGYPKNRTMAENIAVMDGCPWTAKQVVKMWLDSPPHRKNLLSAKLRDVGVGVVTTGECGVTYFVTDFGG